MAQKKQSWMQESTLATHEQLRREHKNGAARKLRKSTFSTFLFQLSGCKFLLHKLIELPLISDSAEQPVTTVLANLLGDYESHLKTDAYKEAVQASQKHQEKQKRLSRQIWWAQYNVTRGRKLSTQVRYHGLNFFELDDVKRQLVEDFDTRRSAKTLDILLKQKRAPYRGTGCSVSSH